MFLVLTIYFLFHFSNTQALPQVQVIVNANNVTGELPHFWESTGLCNELFSVNQNCFSPPDPHSRAAGFLLGKDMKINLKIIASIPHFGIKQVRIHWLLNLINIRVHKNGTKIYDFQHLDSFLLYMVSIGLRPGFELMGNPSQYFANFEEKSEIYAWKDMIQIDVFGIDEVKIWNFESWNEPDHHDFDNLNITLQGFLNYYDACSEGLRAANKLLRFGGPGASCRFTGFSKICWALLDHVTSGRNYFTGEKNVGIDFISFHKKGDGSSENILQEEIRTIKYIRQKYPSLKNISIYNDEGDPMKGWSKIRSWRADATYAAMVAKVIIQHHFAYNGKKKKIFNFALLSNDNAFLNYAPNYFSERTLLARIQINNTVPKQVQFIRKPVYTVMGLLSKLGQNAVKASIIGLSKTQQLLVIASMDVQNQHWQQAILIIENASIVVFMVDNYHANPYRVWRMNSSPVFPSSFLLKQMRLKEEPARILGPTSFSPEVDNNVTFELSLPGIALIHICSSSYHQSVNNVEVLELTNCDALITWMDSKISSKCILTYEVEFTPNVLKEPFKRINPNDIIFNTFQYSPENCNIRGLYRVRGINYKKEASTFSDIINFNY
ncbi:Alpha-L-iduronidase [Nymphon striatum]|nr:Alpha-L-iduronidase [Nymphon striatum]